MRAFLRNAAFVAVLIVSMPILAQTPTPADEAKLMAEYENTFAEAEKTGPKSPPLYSREYINHVLAQSGFGKISSLKHIERICPTCKLDLLYYCNTPEKGVAALKGAAFDSTSFEDPAPGYFEERFQGHSGIGTSIFIFMINAKSGTRSCLYFPRPTGADTALLTGTGAQTATAKDRPTIVPAAAQSSYTLATGSSQGVYAPLGATLVSAIKAAGGPIGVEIQTTGSQENIQRVSEGKATIGFATANMALSAVQGTDPYSKPLPINAVAFVYPSPINIVTLANRGIQTLQDLNGKRLALGGPGTSVEKISLALIEAAGIRPSPERFDFPSNSELARAMRGGEIDAFFWIGSLSDAVVQELAAPITLIDSAHVVDAMNAKVGRLYDTAPIPANTYPGQKRDNRVAAVWNILVTRDTESPETIYNIIEGMFAAREAWAAKRTEAFNLSLGKQLPDITPIPFHPGALRYFAESGITVPTQSSRGAIKAAPRTATANTGTASIAAATALSSPSSETQPSQVGAKALPQSAASTATPTVKTSQSGAQPLPQPSSPAASAAKTPQSAPAPTPSGSYATVEEAKPALNPRGEEYVKVRYSDGSHSLLLPQAKWANECIRIRKETMPPQRFKDGSVATNYTYRNACPKKVTGYFAYGGESETWAAHSVSLDPGGEGSFSHHSKGPGMYYFVACESEDSVCNNSGLLWRSRLAGKPITTSPTDVFTLAQKDNDPATMQRITKNVETANDCVSLSSNRESYSNSCSQPVSITSIYRLSGDTNWFAQITSKVGGGSSTQSMLPGGNAYNRMTYRDIQVLACYAENSACQGARTEIWDKCSTNDGCNAPAILDKHGVKARRLM